MAQRDRRESAWQPSEQPTSLYEEDRGWGWTIFAGTMILIVGAFNIIDGLVAIFQTGYYRSIAAVNSIQLPVTNQLHTWGWVAFIIGIVMVFAGVAIYSRATWARWTGIVLAGLNMIFQLAFMASFPFWSFTMVLLDAAVIYGLAAYSGRRAY